MSPSPGVVVGRGALVVFQAFRRVSVLAITGAVLAGMVGGWCPQLEAQEPGSITAKGVDTDPPDLDIQVLFGTVTNDNTPGFLVTYSDAASGVNLSSLVIELDGVNFLPSCNVLASRAICEASPVADGAHELTVSIQDNAGNPSTDSLAFAVDTTGPSIFIGGRTDFIFADGFETQDTSAWETPNPLVYSNQVDPQLVVALDDLGADVDPGSLTVTVDGVDITDSCVFDAEGFVCTSVGLEEGEREVVVTIADTLGNGATALATWVVDRTPPTIIASVDPAPNAAGWHQGPVNVSFSCADALSGVFACPGPRTVDTEGADQAVPAIVTDRAGNSADANLTLSIDLTAPTFDSSLFNPVPCPTRTLQLQPEVRACFADAVSGIDEATVQLIVDGVDRSTEATVAGSCISWSPGTALDVGEHQGEIAAVDVAGNPGTASWCFDLGAPTLEISIDSPSSGLLTVDELVDVTGTVEDAAETVEVNGLPANLVGNDFSITGVPLREGRNVITAVARNAEGRVGTASVIAVRDTSPPVVRIETPGDGAILTSLQTDVAGLVNDLVTGTTINADDCDVFVNGVEAEVANRSFLVTNLLLKRGANTLVAEARDRMGNSSTHTIDITVRDKAGQRIVLLAGNNQSAEVFNEIPEPLIVALETSEGDSLPGEKVIFEVSRGDGILRSFPEEGSRVEVTTDDVGHASVRFQLSGRSGAGNNRVRVTAPGFVDAVEFCAEATPSEPTQILVLSGNNQHGVIERQPPQPLVVLVTDSGGNPVSGVDVTFNVTEGEGSFGGSPSALVTTDLDGLASADWTLGPDAGLNNNRAEATFPGLGGASAAFFFASGDAPGPAEDTRLVGLVLDNQDDPMPGVTIHVEGTALQTVTDDMGRFAISGVPVGSILFEVIGSTTPRPGVWPTLEFDLTTISGRDNAFDRPIYLLPLDVDSGVQASATEDITVKMANVPGAELTVYANSVTCPDGSTDCEISVTQVRNERVPMEPPMGSSFMLAWTIQPAGAKFDPPAQLCIPSSGMPIGQQVEVFSFDHDQQAFVATGTATVTDDGEQICSDPGFGVFKAGWHGCVPPPPPPTCADSCDDGNPCTQDLCVEGSCENQPQNEGQSCSDGSICGEHQCQMGVCVKLEMEPDGTPCDDNSLCTENDACMGGFCRGDMLDCDDGNECTSDNCLPDQGCVQDFRVGSCDDMDACTENDVCSEGSCSGVPKDCSDDNSCTTDSCDAMGMCVNDPDPGMDGMRCDDMSGCSLAICMMGVCEEDTSQTDGEECDDMDMCTENDMCMMGECVGEDVDTSEFTDDTSVGIEVGAPTAVVNLINSAVNYIPGVDITIQEVKGSVSAKSKDCCDPVDGIIDEGVREAQAMVSLNAAIEDIPIWGAPFDLELDLEVVELEFEFNAGVFLNSFLSFAGSAGYRVNDCTDIDCVFGSLSAGFIVEPRVSLEGEACLEIEIGPVDREYCAGFNITPLKITIPYTGSVFWNKDACGDNFTGQIGVGEITFTAEACVPFADVCVGVSHSIATSANFTF